MRNLTSNQADTTAKIRNNCFSGQVDTPENAGQYEVFSDSRLWPINQDAVPLETAYRIGVLAGAEECRSLFDLDSHDAIGRAVDRANDLSEIRRSNRVYSFDRIKPGDQVDIEAGCVQARLRGHHQTVEMAIAVVDTVSVSVVDELTAIEQWANAIKKWSREPMDASDAFFSSSPTLASFYPTETEERLLARSAEAKTLPTSKSSFQDSRNTTGKPEMRSTVIESPSSDKTSFGDELSEARRATLNAIEEEKALFVKARNLGIRIKQVAGCDGPMIGGTSLSEGMQCYPDRREYLINGLLRRGEVMNIIAAPKVGKSWMVYNGILSLAAGRQWIGFDGSKPRTLLLDNELHREELFSRLGTVAEAMGIEPSTLDDHLVIRPMRGESMSLDDIETMLCTEFADDHFDLIVIDAFYRVLPDKISENDNAAMTRVYNQIDAIAAHKNASVVLIHHASKGDQSHKSITDVGAGAGAMTRATDTHLTIREHQDEGCVVVDAVTRSSQQPASRTARFEWPLWNVLDGVDPILKSPKSGADRKQEERDSETDAKIREVLSNADTSLSRSAIRRKTVFGQARVDAAISRIGDELESDFITNPKNKNDEIEVYRIKNSTSRDWYATLATD
ncbi:hypothetical protein Pla22_45560 [Rubripirellula amarantea]|uniref:Regulatory protein RepA n=1 Tax=Rubripirellula amarantea TaxID=2527999 RepID=A0A5C5WFC9_9BACT|nr:AAA family ATPase [Rubripirellula amarantea]TWT49360.1 hypothetical protein Pla22_45560 [Rubripirellula amarantea]